MKSLFFSILLLGSMASLANSALEVGDTICVEGFIMDFYCINQGRMIDNGLVTLQQPDRHSVHCLVEVNSCINSQSPFEVLVDPVAEGGMYARGWRVTEDAKQDLIMLAQGIGSCRTCVEGYTSSKLARGFRAVMNATILDLNEGSDAPPLIEVHDMDHSHDKVNACNAIFGMTDVLEEVGNNSTLFSTGVETNLRAKHIAHASLMLIAWGFLLPLGAFGARFLKHRPDELWFQIHKICQILGLFLASIGWIIALRNFDVFGDIGYNNYRHGVCGMTTMILGLLQPLNAVIRPHAANDGSAKTTSRKIWEVLHKGTGFAALVLAIATIVLGTTILPEPDDQTSFQIALGILLGILLIIVIWFMMDKKTYTPLPSSKSDARPAKEEGAPSPL